MASAFMTTFPSDRHAADFEIGGDDLVADGDGGLQRLLGAHHRVDHCARVGLALQRLRPRSARPAAACRRCWSATSAEHAGEGRAACRRLRRRAAEQRAGASADAPPSGFEVECADAARSSLVPHQVDGHGDQLARLLDDLQIGLVGAVGLAHVGHFDQHVDVGHLDVALVVGGLVAGLELDREVACRRGRSSATSTSEPPVGAVELGGEADGLAAIGIGAGRVAGRLGVGEVFRNDAQPLRLGAEAGGGDFQGGGKRVHGQLFETSMSHAVERLDDRRVELEGAADFAGLHQLVLQHDGVLATAAPQAPSSRCLTETHLGLGAAGRDGRTCVRLDRHARCRPAPSRTARRRSAL